MSNALLLQPPLPQPSQHVAYWDNAMGAGLALSLAETALRHPAPLLVITPDTTTANRLQREIGFFLAQQRETIPVLLFPDWETLPYDHFSPHQDITSQRLQTLYQLSALASAIILAPISTLMQRIAPREFIEKNSFALQVGDQFNPERVRQRLQQNGYHCVTQVFEHGEFSIRGSIFDLFPTGSDTPYRIDLFDDQVDSIRTFEPESQRSIDKVAAIELLPAKEFPFDDEGISRFRQHWRELFAGNPLECPIYEDISRGITAAGIEYYLPMFFAHTHCLLDYLPANAFVISVGNLNRAGEHFWQEVNDRYQQLNGDRTRPLLPPERLLFRSDELFQQMKSFQQIKINHDTRSDKSYTYLFDLAATPALTVNHKLQNPLQDLQLYLPTSRRVLFCVDSPGRRESLIDLLGKAGIHPTSYASWTEFLTDHAPLGITVAPLDKGVIIQTNDITLIAESELFGQQVRQQRRRQAKIIDSENIVRNLAELSLGSPVVHIQHGVGRYLGLETFVSGNEENEFLTLEYADQSKLYVPITDLHLISRYSGVELEHAPLHQLGSKRWQTEKQKIAKQLRDVAAELLAIYAKRASRPGLAFSLDEEQYARFCEGFPFEETPDQETAIAAVIADMLQAKPMDRLICGDVGFGKTEVAMRAAFIAVQNNKQVAILVPTTLLAQQHFDSFKDRFADWPINIDVISRFRTAKQQQTIIDQVTAGKLDIIIGTHKLLQSSIQFNALGLLIIDEEHRFGVQQKERLKKLRAEVDLLTLTATPIPRTLNMAMANIRDLSIIATPPARRLSIKTFVHERSDSLIKEALQREILRGGQVYFLHNSVETIEQIADEVAQLIPEARVRVGHGQMRERELEQVMSDFYHQRFNVLVCTTIIETGIDIPSANTIVIDRADRFGLAQLHQLRGRVGRSHHQAYAYLLTPNKKTLTADAKKRLEAIAQLEDLGAGFTLATHDLEIRGAGDLLGQQQSGNIHTIGLALYTELLEKSVKALKSGKELDINLPEETGPEVKLNISALIPADYLADVHSRLVLYKRIANAGTPDALDEIQVEMIDRFGLLPEAAKNLFHITHLKFRLIALGIRKLDASTHNGTLEFAPETRIEPLTIVNLVQKQSHAYQLIGANCLRFKLTSTDATDKLAKINKLLDTLSAPAHNATS